MGMSGFPPTWGNSLSCKAIPAKFEKITDAVRGDDLHMNILRRIPFHWIGLLIIGSFLLTGTPLSNAQLQQDVYVTIEGYTFRTTQIPLQLNTEIIIHIQNMDEVRHDFGSDMFLNILTHVESNGVVTYGKGIEGAYLNPGQSASIRLILDHPGRFQFQCSIHKDMKGEILLLTVDAV
jgi:uncharacterized cupredoxin-like copper-binding protein